MSEYTSYENQKEILEALVLGVDQNRRNLSGIMSQLDSINQQIQEIKEAIQASALRETIGRVTIEHDGLVPQLPEEN